ncbi:MAG TPA: ATP-binding protein [Patescibacteria group bacterium]|nr:ATP-binding protein [Patescibacteria group bacterium]
MQGKNKALLRYIKKNLQEAIRKKQSCLIVGPRQVGKTTLVNMLLQSIQEKMEYLLQDPTLRIELEKDPGKIIRQVDATQRHQLVFIDEAQKIPDLFDAVQLLIDQKKAHCILTGSSARKLRRSGANLLPGRIKRLYMDPLVWGEFGWMKNNSIKELSLQNINTTVQYTFEDSLIFGALPGMVNISKDDRSDFLRSYAEIYLEEEIRAEAIVRKIGAFSRFLELAAAESGTSPNLTKLSNESGVSVPAIKEFYQVLEDTLIVERIEPYIKNARKRLLASPRYYFFDIGVRNALARLPLEADTINIQKGVLFEHAVILEIIRRIRVLNKQYRVCFWRTSGGAEVDCVIDMGNKIIPIEIKSSASIVASELKGLKHFLSDYAAVASHGYVITMGKKKEQLAENITAIPWFEL